MAAFGQLRTWLVGSKIVGKQQRNCATSAAMVTPPECRIMDKAVAYRPATHALDAMAKAPEHHALLLENASVRFLDTRVGPGERTPVHAHEWPAALYVLSWSDFVRYDLQGNVLLDSRTMATRPATGSALWSAPIGPHFVENVGTTDLHILAIEIKS